MNYSRNKEKRRMLRKNQTKEEKLLWEILRRRRLGFKWRRQVGIGEYIADFYCHAQKLVIELDGKQHETAVEYDLIRDKFFNSLGIKVIRISNEVFNGDLEIIYKKINESLYVEALS